jgi:hypothetical protein
MKAIISSDIFVFALLLPAKLDWHILKGAMLVF